jgi:parallel beta-helix repeat protein
MSNIVAFNLGEGISVDPGSGNTVLDNLLVENGDQG